MPGELSVQDSRLGRQAHGVCFRPYRDGGFYYASADRFAERKPHRFKLDSVTLAFSDPHINATIHVHLIDTATQPPLPPAHCTQHGIRIHSHLHIALIAFAFGSLLTVPISGGRIFIAMIMLDGLGGWNLPLGPKVVYIH